jgi:hypothetical protein
VHNLPQKGQGCFALWEMLILELTIGVVTGAVDNVNGKGKKDDCSSVFGEWSAGMSHGRELEGFKQLGLLGQNGWTGLG